MIAILLLLPPVRVQAESGDGFRLDSSGNIILDSSHAAKEGISSLSFTLTVEPEVASSIDFVFAGSSAEIVEYRYHADEKKMNIYMAGTAPLFPEGTESLSVGKVVISDGNGQSGVATVGVESGSLKFVYGSELRPMEGVDIPEKVRVGASDAPPTQTPPPPPTQTPEPPKPTQTPASSQPVQPPAPPVSQTPVQPTETPKVPVPTIAPQHPISQGGNGAGKPKPTTTPQEKEDDSDQSEDIFGVTPIPLETESPGDTWEESIVEVSLEEESEEGDGPGQDSTFLENVKLIVTGFAIASVLAGTGTAAVAFLIKKPWR